MKNNENLYESLQLVQNSVNSQSVKNMKAKLEKEIKSITDQIIRKYNPDRIILFGSVASGDLNSDSDADFLIIKEDTPNYGAERIRELSRIIDRNIAVDFLIYRPDEIEKRVSMGDPFLKSIMKEGRVLYG